MHEWLSAPKPCFLTGSAGRGKSALLLHFAAALLRDHADIALLFLPISIRFETADELTGLRLLYLQLSGVFAELRLNESMHPDKNDYRDSIATAWHHIASQPSRRFVLIVDGADEATGDWIEREVLPYEVPGNLFVIVSARRAHESPTIPEWLSGLHASDAHLRSAPLAAGGKSVV